MLHAGIKVIASGLCHLFYPIRLVPIIFTDQCFLLYKVHFCMSIIFTLDTFLVYGFTTSNTLKFMTTITSKSKTNIYFKTTVINTNLAIFSTGKQVTMHRILVLNRFHPLGSSKVSSEVFLFRTIISSHLCCIFALLKISSYLFSHSVFLPSKSLIPSFHRYLWKHEATLHFKKKEK